MAEPYQDTPEAQAREQAALEKMRAEVERARQGSSS